jgi:L-asparaginase
MLSAHKRLPKVTVLGLGGTIASIEQRDTDANPQGALPELTAKDLLAAVPGAATVAQVTGRSLRQVSSASLSVVDVLELSSAIGELLGEGADGIVVTQGTDTLEETSFILDLLHRRPEPIVVTGAMRVASSSGADGPANLLAAIRVAAAPQARDLGAMVVMSDEIHAARWVMKRHTSRVTAFDSPMTGPIGWVSEGHVRIAMRPVACPRLDIPNGRALCPIATVALGLGDDGRLLPGIPSKGYGGLIIEAMGGGHVPEATVAYISEVAAEIPVVIASRTGSGELLRSTYGFPGSERDMLSRGVISAGALSAPKARLLLMLLLTSGTSRDDLAGLFGRYSLPGQAEWA